MKHVPFLNLAPYDADFKFGKTLNIVQSVLKSGHFILGEQVEAFEEEFAQYIGVKHCIGVGNGFDALQLCLHGAGITQGDWINVPTNAPLPVWMAVSSLGIGIEPCEPFYETFQINPENTARHILAVHLYGMPADMDLVRESVLDGVIIEDCCQAHGAIYRDMKVGSIGTASAFSFYPTKNLACFGDGGAVCTNSDDIARFVRMAREYGQGRAWGMNSRLDELQAAFLREGLKHLDDENDFRREKADVYRMLLAVDDAKGNLMLPRSSPYAVPVWHQFVIRATNRDKLRRFLLENDVDTMIHYPVPCHKMPWFDNGSSYPMAEQLSNEVVSLPIGRGIELEDVEYVGMKIAEFYAS